MTELETIQHKAQEANLEFLLIGGLAVIQHGFVRTTTDIDLLVRKGDSESWRRMLEGLGYRYDHGTHNFQQYERREFTGWPLDLMLVNEPTYEKLAKGSVPANVFGALVRMVSVPHLIALKLHVLKQRKIHRFLDDFINVVELVKANRLDLQSEEIRALFLKYGTADLYDKVRSIVAEK